MAKKLVHVVVETNAPGLTTKTKSQPHQEEGLQLGESPAEKAPKAAVARVMGVERVDHHLHQRASAESLLLARRIGPRAGST